MDNLYIESSKEKRFNFQNLNKVPFYPIFNVLMIIAIGCLALYSAGNGNFRVWTLKHIIHALIGFFIFIPVVSLNLKTLKSISYLSFLASLFLLFFVLILGKKILGATRWINLGFITIQPSEIAKLTIILTLANYYDNLKRFQMNFLRLVFIPILITSFLAIPIILQPDLTTGGICFLLTFSIVFFFIKDFRIILIPIFLFLLSLPVLWFKFLKEFQKMRILNFLDSNIDPLGSGYNVIQSKIAIGSGGLFGKGFLKGTQGQLKFIPEHHSDFIFSLIAEETGFAGVLFVILLFFFFIKYGYSVLRKAELIFEKVLVIGSVNLISIHVFINIAMTCGLFPAAGIPLPMISSGGTMMIVSIICLALLLNVDINSDSLNVDNF